MSNPLEGLRKIFIHTLLNSKADATILIQDINNYLFISGFFYFDKHGYRNFIFFSLQAGL
ncbi:hypothetical protein K8S19_09045 [bacterium]|nr:hypothetical protein [bacterium]